MLNKYIYVITKEVKKSDNNGYSYNEPIFGVETEAEAEKFMTKNKCNDVECPKYETGYDCYSGHCIERLNND